MKGTPMHKSPQQDRDFDYAPFTPYDKEKYVRIFYTRYSPARNRRHTLVLYGSTALVAALLLLTLFLGAKTDHHFATAACAFLSCIGIMGEILLYRHAEKNTWLCIYRHTEQSCIKKGQPLYYLRDQIWEDRIAKFIGILLASAVIGWLIWFGIQNLCLLV